MLASVALQILPETLDDEQTIKVVDEVIAYMKSTGLECYVAPFETAIEGSDIDQLMDIMGVAAFIKVVYRPDGDVLTIEKKVTKHHL